VVECLRLLTSDNKPNAMEDGSYPDANLSESYPRPGISPIILLCLLLHLQNKSVSPDVALRLLNRTIRTNNINILSVPFIKNCYIIHTLVY
jgi:hypothetical protein